jgi:hypothetical protein
MTKKMKMIVDFLQSSFVVVVVVVVLVQSFFEIIDDSLEK